MCFYERKDPHSRNDMQVMSANRFSALLDSHCWRLQQKCYVMVIFVGFCCCTGKFSRTCMLQLLRFILRLSPCISRPGNFDRSASSTTYKWHIEVAVSLGPSSPLKWPGNAFLCVKCLSINVIITAFALFSNVTHGSLKFEIWNFGSCFRDRNSMGVTTRLLLLATNTGVKSYLLNNSHAKVAFSCMVLWILTRIIISTINKYHCGHKSEAECLIFPVVRLCRSRGGFPRNSAN